MLSPACGISINTSSNPSIVNKSVSEGMAVELVDRNWHFSEAMNDFLMAVCDDRLDRLFLEHNLLQVGICRQLKIAITSTAIYCLCNGCFACYAIDNPSMMLNYTTVSVNLHHSAR
jgi:hypothetical protein